MTRRWQGQPLIFVNYRSMDEPSTASLLHRELGLIFGENAVFRDCDSIEPGADYEPMLVNSVRGCAVLLVVIGPRWFEAAADGRPRIADPADWVRREIVEALALGVRVIPVLVGDAPQLAAADLPGDVAVIARHQYVHVRHRYERADIAELVDDLRRSEPRLDAAAIANRRTAAERGGAAPVSTLGTLDLAAANLADDVFEQWTNEIVVWELDQPKIVTRWWFRPAPEFGEPASRWTSGEPGSINELARRVNDLPRLRLAVLGEGGAGKTGLAMQLVRRLARPHLPGDKVAVLVPAAGWNAQHESLRDFLVGRLTKDYPALRATRAGGQPAAELLAARRIIPVLDGLDELPPDSREAALRALGRASDDDEWIITCRTAVFSSMSAITTAVVDATLTAERLTADDSHHYLRRLVRDEPAWQPLLAQLRTSPGSPLAVAASTPLVLWLIRQTYVEPRADPAGLADWDDADALRHHLLERLVPSLVERRTSTTTGANAFLPARRWRPERSRYWLVNLAGYLTANETTELAWWRMTDLGPRRPRLTLAIVMMTLTAVLTGSVTFALAGPVGLIPTTSIVLLFALAAISCKPRAEEPRFASFRLAGRIRELLVGVAYYAVIGALAGGVLVLASVIFSDTRVSLWIALATGWWVMIGLSVCGWATAATHLDGARSPADVLRADRNLTLVYAAVAAPPICAYAGVVTIVPIGYSVAVGVGLALTMLAPATVYVAFMAVRPSGSNGSGVYTGHAWSAYSLMVGWAVVHRILPLRFMPFLADMHRLGILRQVGAVYQFRHADLQEVLTREFLTDLDELDADPS